MFCPKCDKALQEFDEERTEDQDGCSIDEGGNVWLEWSPKDTEFGLFGVCIACQVMMVQCTACGEDMQFLGHQGYRVDGKCFSRVKGKDQTELKGTPKPSSKSTGPRYDVTDLDKMYFEFEDWHPCGADGDMKHTWRCLECQTNHNFGTA